MNKLSVVFCIVCLSLLFASISFAAGTIKIGGLFAVTGPASFLGEPEKKTLEMLVKEANDKGGQRTCEDPDGHGCSSVVEMAGR